MDGCVLDTDGEKERVIKCLVASIERRVSHVSLVDCNNLVVSAQRQLQDLIQVSCLSLQGLRLDLCTEDRVGLLSDITRLFREHGMSLSRADLGTNGEQAIGSFYVTDSSGNDVDLRTVELVRNEIGKAILRVNKSSSCDSQNYSSNSKHSIENRTSKSSLGGLLWGSVRAPFEQFWSHKIA